MRNFFLISAFLLYNVHVVLVLYEISIISFLIMTQYNFSEFHGKCTGWAISSVA